MNDSYSESRIYSGDGKKQKMYVKSFLKMFKC